VIKGEFADEEEESVSNTGGNGVSVMIRSPVCSTGDSNCRKPFGEPMHDVATVEVDLFRMSTACVSPFCVVTKSETRLLLFAASKSLVKGRPSPRGERMSLVASGSSGDGPK
jgi:hypothetical protein